MESHCFKKSVKILVESTVHFLWRVQNPGTASKAKRFELLSVIYKSGPLNWTQTSFLSYTHKRETQQGGNQPSQLQPGQDWERRAPSVKEMGNLNYLPTLLSLLDNIFFLKSRFIHETGFLILVLVNIFMRNVWKNSKENKSVINKREEERWKYLR